MEIRECVGRRVGQAFLLGALIVAALGSRSAAFAKRKKAPPPPADVSDHVRDLAQKLYGMALDDAEPITDEIEKAVLSDLDAWAVNRVPTDVEMRRELERVFSKLHYPLIGDPVVLAAAWRGRTLLCAGYTLGWTDTNKVNVVAMFESAGGKTHRVTVTNFVPYTDLHFETLPVAGSGDFRFITYGNRLGKSQVRLTAILYDYDGQALKKLWEVDDAYDGKIDVTPTTVTLRYLRESEYIEAQTYNRKPPRHESVYKVMPEGLTLTTDHEIPF
jgi:hypothetical protein